MPLWSERPSDDSDPPWWRTHLYEHYPRLMFASDLLTFQASAYQIIELLGVPDVHYSSPTHEYARFYRFGLELTFDRRSDFDLGRLVWARFIGPKIPYRWSATDQAELRRLQGGWVLVETDENGVREPEKLPPGWQRGIVFEGDIVRVCSVIDPAAPFRLTRIEGHSGLAISPEVKGGWYGPEGLPMEWIYELSGDELKIQFKGKHPLRSFDAKGPNPILILKRYKTEKQ
jgi:hypothetical protein